MEIDLCYRYLRLPLTPESRDYVKSELEKALTRDAMKIKATDLTAIVRGEPVESEER